MKTTIIAFSILGNLFLVGLLAFPKASGSLVSVGGAGIGKSATATAGGGVSAPAAAGSKALPANGAVTWKSFSSAEAQTFVDQARSAGMPDSLIRSLLQLKLNEPLAARRKELAGPPQQVPYWKMQLGPTGVLTPQASAELRQMSQANARLVATLLGPDPMAYVSPYEKLQYGNLPPDKVEQLKLVIQDYSELTQSVRIGSVLLPEDRAKIAYFDSEKEKDIRALLSPAEYEEYQFRSSTTANSMRRNLEMFEPSEAEFRAIFPLQEAFDKKFNLAVGGPLPQELMQQRQAEQQRLAADIKASLDPSRAADYERTTDNAYRTMTQIVNRMELPKETATVAWQAQKDIQARATAIRQGTPNMQTRIEQLTALQAEANQTFSSVLGEKGYDTYKQTSGGWINTLVPQVLPANAARGAAVGPARGAAAPARGGQ